MPLSRWFEGPRRLLVWFLVVTAAPLAALGWLGWRSLAQERALEGHRLLERQENAADVAVAALQRVLAEAEEKLTAFSANAPTLGTVGPNELLVLLWGRAVVRHSGAPLVYLPTGRLARSGVPEPPEKLFSAGDALEFQKRDHSGAIVVFRELTRSANPRVRAAALLRLARNLRKAGRYAEARAAFDQLKKLGLTPVGGLPAELVARQGRALLFKDWNRREDLEREASDLYGDARSGRWPLSRASYLFLAEQTNRWLGRADPQPGEEDSLALAAAIEFLWAEWRNGGLEGNPRGRRAHWTHHRSMLLVWRASRTQLAVAAMGPAFLESQWLAGLEPLRAGQRIEFALADFEGNRAAGALRAGAPRQAVRTAADTGLPWTLHAVAAPAGDVSLSGRLRPLFAALALVAAVMMIGTWFITRAISRELAVGRLQSDFVAAVSHEFRTPLTTLRQLSELLLRDRVSSDDRRREFYQVLVRESERLRRLVEDLLDFRRMEAGARAYRFESVDVASLVRSVVAEFQQEVAATGFRIDLRENGPLPLINADPASLATLFRNLLDNAVKYSPESRVVWVDAARQGKHLAVRVRDQGLGIPGKEQKEIFRKFYRGSASKASSIKGTGIGLAMAREIARAHRGEITVASASGEGSTFTVLLPATES